MSKRVLDMLEKLSMVDGDDFHIIDSQDASLPTKDKKVKKSNALAGLATESSVTQVQSNLTTHENDSTNPHGVTAAQAGADPVGSANAVQSNLTTHENDSTNPHNVTAAQAGADAAGTAAAAVSAHDGDAGAHSGNIPSTSQKAALDAATTLSGANPVASINDIPAGGADEKAGVSATDTTPDYLQAKLTSGDASVSITRINAGGDEQLDLRATGAGGGEANTGENIGTGVEVYAGMNGTILQSRSIIDTANVEWTQGATELSAFVPASTFDTFGAAAAVNSALTTHKSSGDHDARYLQSVVHADLTDLATSGHPGSIINIAAGVQGNAVSIAADGTLEDSGVPPGGAGGTTDLSVINRTSTALDVASSSGQDATLPAATSSLAGLATALHISNITENAQDLTAHKSSADHDARYYTKAQQDSTDSLQDAAINDNVSNISERLRKDGSEPVTGDLEIQGSVTLGDGYTEQGDTTLTSSAGTLTVPLDGKPRVMTLTENVTLAVSAPIAPICGNCKITLIQAAGDYTVTVPAGWYTDPDGDLTMPTGSGARKVYLLDLEADGEVNILAQARSVTP